MITNILIDFWLLFGWYGFLFIPYYLLHLKLWSKISHKKTPHSKSSLEGKFEAHTHHTSPHHTTPHHSASHLHRTTVTQNHTTRAHTCEKCMCTGGPQYTSSTCYFQHFFLILFTYLENTCARAHTHAHTHACTHARTHTHTHTHREKSRSLWHHSLTFLYQTGVCRYYRTQMNSLIGKSYQRLQMQGGLTVSTQGSTFIAHH